MTDETYEMPLTSDLRNFASAKSLRLSSGNYHTVFATFLNWNSENGAAFDQALQDHIANAPQQIPGTYRGTTPVTHYYDPSDQSPISFNPKNRELPPPGSIATSA
jgi:hypothetical protein